jgi:hypothetical protein
MRISTGVTPSKTEAIYSPPPRRLNYDADTSRLGIIDYLGEPVGFIDFTTEFKYLGSIAHHSLTYNADVDKRIRLAPAASGDLKSVLTNQDIDLKLKGRVNVARALLET